jgi:hypothetical protein
MSKYGYMSGKVSVVDHIWFITSINWRPNS